jgi:threonine dehydrogenase-like Zn-dependent dehydrogenase
VNERGTPVITESHDAIVKVTTAAICGSDLHMYFNEVPGVNVMQVCASRRSRAFIHRVNAHRKAM